MLQQRSRIPLPALLGGLGLALLAACNSPFIPIPPPNPTFEPPVAVEDGRGGTRLMWGVFSPPTQPMARATVFLFNRDLGQGVIVRAGEDGAYSTSIEGQREDEILIHFETDDGESSQSICRPLREGHAAVPCQ
jgi:hypothetical protein